MKTCVLVENNSADMSKCLMDFFVAGRLDEVMEMTLQQILRSWQPLVSCDQHFLKKYLDVKKKYWFMFSPGKELEKLGKDINALTPVSEVPFPTR